MRKAKEILRLKHERGLTNREIARSCHISHVTVSAYLERAETAGLKWPLPEEVDDQKLRELLFASQKPSNVAKRPLPDMAGIHEQLRLKGVTLRTSKPIGLVLHRTAIACRGPKSLWAL